MAVGLEKLDNLDPAFVAKARYVVNEMEKSGWKIRIVWGMRSYEENKALADAGFAKRDSAHLTGRALDLIDQRLAYNFSPGHQYAQDLSRIAKSVGLIWGGDWISPWDPCHIELP